MKKELLILSVLALYALYSAIEAFSLMADQLAYVDKNRLVFSIIFFGAFMLILGFGFGRFISKKS